MIDRRPERRNRIRTIIPGLFVLMVLVGTGAIGDSLLATNSQRHITAELACQEPPHCEETGAVIGSPTPFYKDYFGENEEVWVAVNPKIIRQIKAIGQINKCITARIYIICHKPSEQWTDDSLLIDITGKKCGEKYKSEPEEITFQPGDPEIIFIQAWKKPSIRDEGYDIVVDFEPFGMYDKGQDILDGLEQKGFLVPIKWVCLESITFNYDPDDDIMDGINLRMNALEEVHVPEWKRGGEFYPAAYIKNRAITVKAVLSSARIVEKAKIRAVTKNGFLGNIVEDTVFFNNGRVEWTFDVTGCTPDNIKSFCQKWEWYLERVDLESQPSFNIATSRNKIFILLERPQSPWKSKGQTEPWSDVLEETCKWAKGAKSPIEAAAKITKQLHMCIGGTYKRYPFYAGSWDGGFDFTSFFRNIKKGQGVGNVNCFDMGKALVAFANSVGCGLVYRQSDFSSCNINRIKSIGKGWTCELKFGPHGFGSIGEKIFDACFKFRKNCIHENKYHDGIFAVNLKWDEYKKCIVRNCYPSYPNIYSFKINGRKTKGFYLRESIDWGKKRRDSNSCEKDYRPVIPGELPDIEAFYCKKKKINLGEKAKVILKIKNSDARELNYYWEISGGGIETDCKGNLFYYGSEPGKHMVKLSVEKNQEIFEPKYFNVTVVNKIGKNISNKNY